MIKLFVTMVDSGTPNYLTAITSPLAAVYALAIHIFQERSSLLIRSDFEVSKFFFVDNPMLTVTQLLKVAVQITKEHYHKHGTADNTDDILVNVEQYVSHCLDTPTEDHTEALQLLSDHARSDEIPLGDTLPAMEAGSSWGPSALDWAGWDWNDLSHLFQHTE